MKKTLVDKLLFPVLVATPLIFAPSSKAQAQFQINPYAQPNDTTMVYHGSCDVDSNNVRNWNDHTLITQGIQNMQSDVDGDGVYSTSQDAELFSRYLNTDTLLPQINWAWPNMTLEQRMDWFLKTGTLDSTRIKHPDWDCAPLATNVAIAFHGFPELEDPAVAQHFSQYDLQNNGKFNLPVYYVTVAKTDGSGWAHAVCAVLIGNNPLNFHDWCIFEPRFANKINIWDWNLPGNSRVNINYNFFEEDGGISTPTFVQFQLNNGVPELTDYYSGLILERPEVKIVSDLENIASNFKLNQNYPNPFNLITTIRYAIPEKSYVTLTIYNVAGQVVDILVNKKVEPGYYTVQWDASTFSTGVYLYRITAGNFSQVKKCILLK